MEKKILQNAGTIRYITFALFVLLAISNLSVRFSLNGSIFAGIVGIAFFVGGVLIPVGIISRKRELSALGCFVMAGAKLLSIGCSHISLSHYLPAAIAFTAADAVAAVNCRQNRKNTMVLSIVCVVLLLLGLLLNKWGIRMEYMRKPNFGLGAIMPLAAYFLLGFSFAEAPAKNGAKPAHNATEDKIERLTKLKDLLDKGILTPEEFEEKKKQILDT